MVMTIQTALAPLLIIGALCGFCVFEYPRGRPRPYFTCLHFLIFWTIYSWFAYYVFVIAKSAINPHWIILIILISSFVSMMVSLFRYKELKTCLRELSLVDNTLEVLGTPKEYRRLYKWMIGVIIVWVVSSNFLNLTDVLWEISTNNYNFVDIFIIFGGNMMLHIDTINGAISGTILGYMGTRFERVNKHIRDLLENDVEHIGNRNMILVARNRILEPEECRQRVWIVMHVHLHLSILSRELNKIFSVQLTLEMATVFTALLDMFFDFHQIYIDKETNTFYQIIANLSVYIWIIAFTAKLLILNHICQTVCDKASGTVAILYKLSNDNIDENLREQILQFILQIKQREVKFSGMGLFYFGDNFVCKFFTSMVTVLIIIIQLSGFHY